MTTDELKAEVNQICEQLTSLPLPERMAWFRKEISHLPATERELISSIVAKTIELSEYCGGRLIVLIHGIRTRAEWQGRLRHLLEEDELNVVEPLGYGFFNVFQFLCPFWTRRKPVNEILLKIRDALDRHRAEKRELLFFGHSFGAYILGTILQENPDIRPDRLLLCGSVLSRIYRWDKLPNRPKSVINEAGSRDIWPILAKSITWGYGSTGTFGFQTAGVRDRHHDACHSDYFKIGFAEKYWVPWIQSGVVVPTDFETGKMPTTPWYKNLLEILPLKWVAIITASLAIVLLAIFRHPHH